MGATFTQKAWDVILVGRFEKFRCDIAIIDDICVNIFDQRVLKRKSQCQKSQQFITFFSTGDPRYLLTMKEEEA